ncbi:NAD(+)/NADH kinase [Kiritimatiella glycovorans]|uniref:NAD kinase n=1 Tax=Kiritimatiella glycovorans TaxID=1307763 RepID=A0A0G3EIV8_9BACT|nr:NAD(+)/NADH kinase [Kiritimatiella glycovorans]AKJ64104.1 putative inorganic polyphosphate/ATP-NAD kinase [Kiritimatiella glycovorans]
MKPESIGIVANLQRADAESVLGRLETRAAERGLALLADPDTAACMAAAESVPAGDLARRADVLFAMGGDGTVLYAARLLCGSDTPILGLNLGSLGFLTTVGEEAVEQAVDALCEGACTIEERAALACELEVPGDDEPARARALNDVVVGWGASSSIVSLDLSVDGEHIATFMCDGLIVSTPTGSTGHSLSAGGPILYPGSPVFAINVICPHTLSSRPLVIPDRSTISIRVGESAKPLVLSIDGRDHPGDITPGCTLHVRRAKCGVRFVHLEEYSYFKLLSQKLHWRGSSI